MLILLLLYTNVNLHHSIIRCDMQAKCVHMFITLENQHFNYCDYIMWKRCQHFSYKPTVALICTKIRTTTYLSYQVFKTIEISFSKFYPDQIRRICWRGNDNSFTPEEWKLLTYGFYKKWNFPKLRCYHWRQTHIHQKACHLWFLIVYVVFSIILLAIVDTYKFVWCDLGLI